MTKRPKAIVHAACVLLSGLGAAPVQAQDVAPEWQDRRVESDRDRVRARVPATAMEYADMRRTGDDMGPRDYRAADLALLSAARRGEWPKVMRLLRGGAPPNVRDMRGDSVLALAAAAGETEVVRALIDAGAHVNRRGASGFTPLGAAALGGHHRVAALLLDGGADVDATSANGHAPLIDAVLLNRQDVVEVLLRHKPQWRFQTDREQGRHALSVAASLGHVIVLDQLIAAGFDVNEPDRAGFNALYWAVFRRQRLAVAHLLASGADAGAMSTDIHD